MMMWPLGMKAGTEVYDYDAPDLDGTVESVEWSTSLNYSACGSTYDLERSTATVRWSDGSISTVKAKKLRPAKPTEDAPFYFKRGK